MFWLSIVLAGIVAWGLGTLWYSPVLFGKAWQNELGMTDEDLQGANMPLIFGSSFVLMCVMMMGMTFVIYAHAEAERTFVHGMFHGLMTGLFYVATALGINYLYQRKSLKLYLIDAGYQVAFLTIGGGILAAFA